MTNILIALVVLLVIVSLVQLTRVSELLAELKNEDVNEVTDNDNKTQGFLYLVVGMGFIVFVVWMFRYRARRGASNARKSMWSASTLARP